MAYDHTTDPTAFLVLDDRSAYTSGGTGTQVTGVANVSASGLAYNALTGVGTGVTHGVDGSGFKFLNFDGHSCLRIPSSSGFDAQFANVGDSGGKAAMVVFDLVNTGTGDDTLLNKGSSAGVFASNGGTDYAVWEYYGPSPQLRTAGIQSWRPYGGGPGSFAVVTRTGTAYGDGRRLYRDGAATNAQAGTLNPADGAGYDLTIGGPGRADGQFSLKGKVRAVVEWNRTPKHHEILATHRYYADRYGFPETLTNQPYSLVVDSNSESTVMQGMGGTGGAFNGEVGVFDRVAGSLGLSLDAVFMLGLGGRSTGEMITDFPGDVAPLVAYLRSLGVPPVVVQWDGINDGFVAANVLSYRNLVAATGAKFVTATSMAKAGVGHSGPSDGTAISAYNAQVLADGLSHGYPVAGLGYDATLSTMAEPGGSFDGTYLSDGVHWTSAGIVLGAPYFVAAVRAALAGSVAAPAANSYRRRRSG